MPEPFLPEIENSLEAARANVDALLKIDRPDRTYDALVGLMPRMLGVARLLGPPLAQTAARVIEVEPELAGIIAVARIGLSLREELVGMAVVALPRINARETLSKADLRRLRALLAQVDVTTRLLEMTFYLANPTDEMRGLLADVKQAGEGALQRQLNQIFDEAIPDDQADRPSVWPARSLANWSGHINALRAAIMRQIVERVRTEQDLRTARLNLALMTIGAITLVIAAALALLQWRLIRPLAQLGLAITRIAAGDRRTPLTIRSATREITAMVTAVETLRQAALVADATARHQREVAERRMLALLEVLGILQTVYEPSRMLERQVAVLSEGIEATLAVVRTLTEAPPATLGSAASAVRQGLREMRAAARSLDETIAAASQAEAEEWPEAEIVACILKVRAQIERRVELAHAFLQPCLMALRDAAAVAGNPPGAGLRTLVDDQFQRVEAMVATLASMSAGVTRAVTLVRQLPPEELSLAA